MRDELWIRVDELQFLPDATTVRVRPKSYFLAEARAIRPVIEGAKGACVYAALLFANRVRLADEFPPRPFLFSVEEVLRRRGAPWKVQLQ